MAATSQSSTGWRFFGVLSFVLLLSMAYNSYQHYVNQKLVGRVEHTTNIYRTVRDSVRRAAPVRVVRVPAPAPQQLVVYRTASLSPAQLAGIRQGLAQDFSQQLRRALAQQAPRPATVLLKQAPTVLALRDSTVVRHRPGTNQLTLATVKTGSFQDKWLTLTGLVKPGVAGQPDSLKVKYQIRNEYDVAAWVKRERAHRFWPFRRRNIYVTLTSKNPNARDTGLEAIPVRKAKKPKK